MKNLLLFIISVSILSICSSCNAENKNEDTKALAVKNEKPSSSVYTYQYVMDNVFDDEGVRLEWHGAPIKNDVEEYLSISNRDKCKDKSCGEKFYLSNKHDTKTIKATINAPFADKDGKYEITKVYNVPPKNEVYIGCSLLCLSDVDIKFVRKIVGSEFVE